jgi:hypothetical protein
MKSDKPSPRRAFVPAAALAKAVDFDADMMRVTLLKATPKQRECYEIGGGGISLHWPELDEDLSIAGLMAGVDVRSA